MTVAMESDIYSSTPLLPSGGRQHRMMYPNRGEKGNLSENVVSGITDWLRFQSQEWVFESACNINTRD